MSQAIKCPSIQHHLVGAKKIQQELARPGALERFISDPDIVGLLRATFAGLYTLDLVKKLTVAQLNTSKLRRS